jgi:hypothetical protein
MVRDIGFLFLSLFFISSLFYQFLFQFVFIVTHFCAFELSCSLNGSSCSLHNFLFQLSFQSGI